MIMPTPIMGGRRIAENNGGVPDSPFFGGTNALDVGGTPVVNSRLMGANR